MSIGDQVTLRLNAIEAFIENAPMYYLPVKVLGWLVLFFALMFTNLLAILAWPISSVIALLNKKNVQSKRPLMINNEEELTKIISTKQVVLIDFWAQWCGPCLLMNKSINALASQVADSVVIVKVDVSTSTALSKKFGVKGLPTVVVFNQGEEALRKSGALTKTQLETMISTVENSPLKE